MSDFFTTFTTKTMPIPNDFMVYSELAEISNYRFLNGTAAEYTKGQSFVGEKSHCRYIVIVQSGYLKISDIDNNSDE